MKTIRAALQTRLDAGATTLAYFVRIERKDGVTLYMTNHVEDITIGANTYVSGAGYTPSAISQNDQGKASTVDVEGILSVLGVGRDDIQAKLYSNARIYIFISDYDDPVVDDIKLISGYWGKVQLKRNRFVTEFVSLEERYTQKVGRTYKPACDTELGSTRCGIVLEPSAWAATTAYTVRAARDAMVGDIVKPTTQNGRFYHCSTAGTSNSSEPSWNTTIGGTTNDNTAVWTTIRAYTLDDTVDSVTNRRKFTANSLTEPLDWWRGGTVTFTSGDNSGFSQEVQTSSITGVIELFDDMPYVIAASDAFTIQAGCRRRKIEDCKDKFDNGINFQGFSDIPLQDEVNRFGGQ